MIEELNNLIKEINDIYSELKDIDLDTYDFYDLVDTDKNIIIKAIDLFELCEIAEHISFDIDATIYSSEFCAAANFADKSLKKYMEYFSVNSLIGCDLLGHYWGYFKKDYTNENLCRSSFYKITKKYIDERTKVIESIKRELSTRLEYNENIKSRFIYNSSIKKTSIKNIKLAEKIRKRKPISNKKISVNETNKNIQNEISEFIFSFTLLILLPLFLAYLGTIAGGLLIGISLGIFTFTVLLSCII